MCKLIRQNYKILTRINKDSILRKLEYIGRISYKSEDKIKKGSSMEFISMIINNKHYSVIEHSSISVKFIIDRGLSHELVRHRLASYTQESTRFVNYGKDKHNNEIVVIAPEWISDEDIVIYNKTELTDNKEKDGWYLAILAAEFGYMSLIRDGYKAECARGLLPTAIKTEIVITANLREWRTIFEQRTSKKAHPMMRSIMRKLLNDFKQQIPIIFDDIIYNE